MYNFYKHTWLHMRRFPNKVLDLSWVWTTCRLFYNFSPGSVPVSNSKCWTLVLLCAFGNPFLWHSCPVLCFQFSILVPFCASVLLCAFGNAFLSSFVPSVSILVPFYFYASVLTFLVSCSFVSMAFLSSFMSMAFLSHFIFMPVFWHSSFPAVLCPWYTCPVSCRIPVLFCACGIPVIPCEVAFWASWGSCPLLYLWHSRPVLHHWSSVLPRFAPLYSSVTWVLTFFFLPGFVLHCWL